MRRTCIFAMAMLFALTAATPAFAHRVNVFAYADGEAVRVECSFSKSQKVRHGRLLITDTRTGEEIMRAETDERGAFSWKPDAAFLQSGHGVKIHLNAGEGHQASWIMEGSELAVIGGGTPAVSGKPVQPEVRKEPSDSSGVQKNAAPAGAEGPWPEWEERMDALLETRLAPMRHMLGQALAALQDDGPRLRDVVGGIGWIIGSLGMGAYMRYRRRD